MEAVVENALAFSVRPEPSFVVPLEVSCKKLGLQCNVLVESTVTHPPRGPSLLLSRTCVYADVLRQPRPNSGILRPDLRTTRREERGRSMMTKQEFKAPPLTLVEVVVRRGGRPRKYATNAERQRAYRKRHPRRLKRLMSRTPSKWNKNDYTIEVVRQRKAKGLSDLIL